MIYDVLIAPPVLLAAVMSPFLWDDPKAMDRGLLTTAMLALTFALWAAPFCLAASFGLAVRNVIARRRPRPWDWLLLVPTLPIVAGLGVFGVQELQDEAGQRQLAHRYAALVAHPEMAGFRRLADILPAGTRVDSAERVWTEWRDEGRTPPDTVDALFADQERCMTGHAAAFRAGRTDKAAYAEQTSSDWADYEALADVYGEPPGFPRTRFLRIE